MLETESARRWLQRWDRQQEMYIADREERFAVIADVVEAAAQRPDPLIVDLGCGPGSLAARLVERLPSARVVGVDADPLLLGMARAAYGDRPGLRFVEGDLRTPGWFDALPLDESPDALVSTTALHWMNRRAFGRLVADAAARLRPGGVFVNGDHADEGDLQPHLDRLLDAVRAGRERRTGAGGAEDWQAWWTAVERPRPSSPTWWPPAARSASSTPSPTPRPSPSRSPCCGPPDSPRSARSGRPATTASWSRSSSDDGRGLAPCLSVLRQPYRRRVRESAGTCRRIRHCSDVAGLLSRRVLRHQIAARTTKETAMMTTPEPFLRAEVDYRRDRIRADFAAIARRREARRARQRPVARRAAAQLTERLAAGS